MEEIELSAGSLPGTAFRTYEYFYEQGWTDGLPIVPPTKELVNNFVQASGRQASETMAVMPPRSGRATVEVIAINAVMAGCRPEYMPTILAVVEAISDPAFRLNILQVTTGATTPFLLINGPIRHELKINCGTGCLGPGWRANATIGRSIRLILQNIGGAVPGVTSMSCFASPLQYSYMCGENEEENPWSPFHIGLGYTESDSTVTVFRATTYVGISGGMGVGADDILKQISTQMPPVDGGSKSALILLGVNHAQALYDAGLTKRDIQQKLWEYAAMPVERFAQDYVAMEQRSGKANTTVVYRTASPDNIYVAVAGGPGPQDVYIGVDSPQTRKIRTS